MITHIIMDGVIPLQDGVYLYDGMSLVFNSIMKYDSTTEWETLRPAGIWASTLSKHPIKVRRSYSQLGSSKRLRLRRGFIVKQLHCTHLLLASDTDQRPGEGVWIYPCLGNVSPALPHQVLNSVLAGGIKSKLLLVYSWACAFSLGSRVCVVGKTRKH